MPKKYAELTEKQKAAICNGCGGKGSLVPVPSFFHKASCNHHDYRYWVGCTEEDRKSADKDFYKAMREDVQRQKWYNKPIAELSALTYYLAVRLFGKKYFYYGDKPREVDEEIV